MRNCVSFVSLSRSERVNNELNEGGGDDGQAASRCRSPLRRGHHGPAPLQRPTPSALRLPGHVQSGVRQRRQDLLQRLRGTLQRQIDSVQRELPMLWRRIHSLRLLPRKSPRHLRQARRLRLPPQQLLVMVEAAAADRTRATSSGMPSGFTPCDCCQGRPRPAICDRLAVLTMLEGFSCLSQFVKIDQGILTNHIRKLLMKVV